MKYLSTLLSRFFAARPPALRVAILAPASSIMIERYVNTIIRQLNIIVQGEVAVVQYDNMTDERRFAHFAREAIAEKYDVILALTYLPGIHARRLYTEHGVFIPTLIITYKDLLPQPLPRHIGGLLIPNNGSFIHRLITTVYPSMKKLLLCGKSKLMNHLPEMLDLQAALKTSGIELQTICLDQPEARVMRQLTEALKTHTHLFMTKDTLAFHYMPTIIPLAQKFNCTVIAGETAALPHGADLVFGYEEEAIGKETAAQLYRISQHPQREIRLFRTAQEVYCPVTTNVAKLSSLFREKRNINFRMINGRPQSLSPRRRSKK